MAAEKHYVKVISTQQLSAAPLKRLGPIITALARAEGLEGHAPSVEVREAVLRMAPYSLRTGQREGKQRLNFNENTGRVRCGLSATDYVKVISAQEPSAAALKRLGPSFTTQACAQRLEGHGGSVEVREVVLRMAAHSPCTGQREGKQRLNFNENTARISCGLSAACYVKVISAAGAIRRRAQGARAHHHDAGLGRRTASPRPVGRGSQWLLRDSDSRLPPENAAASSAWISTRTLSSGSGLPSRRWRGPKDWKATRGRWRFGMVAKRLRHSPPTGHRSVKPRLDFNENTARVRGGFSAADCVEVISTQQLSAAIKRLRPMIATPARAEGLEGHARSVEVRNGR